MKRPYGTRPPSHGTLKQFREKLLASVSLMALLTQYASIGVRLKRTGIPLNRNDFYDAVFNECLTMHVPRLRTPLTDHIKLV